MRSCSETQKLDCETDKSSCFAQDQGDLEGQNLDFKITEISGKLGGADCLTSWKGQNLVCNQGSEACRAI